ncbi:hypothetical protein TNCV_518991 [Trichonephila clavipes]|nr:hypothetical protein TNCV_518991 [Trichonephila clavipes]
MNVSPSTIDNPPCRGELCMGVSRSLGQTLSGDWGQHKDSDLHRSPWSEKSSLSFCITAVIKLSSPAEAYGTFYKHRAGSYALMIFILAEGNAAERVLRGRYPQRDASDLRKFTDLHHILWEYRSLRGNRHKEWTRVTRTPNMALGLL